MSCSDPTGTSDPTGNVGLSREEKSPRYRPRTRWPIANPCDRTQFSGVEGLKSYLLAKRRDDFLRQFCRKLLGYALGRATQLSDRPLLDEMMANLHKNDFRFSAAVETVVRSRQFRYRRVEDR